jgi:hypothetical protein
MLQNYVTEMNAILDEYKADMAVATLTYERINDHEWYRPYD